MKDRKLKHLFEAVRAEKPPSPPDYFDGQVMSAIRREQRAQPPTTWEQLSHLFPRLATAAIVAIALFCLADICHSAFYSNDIQSDMEQLSDEWLFAANGGVNE